MACRLLPVEKRRAVQSVLLSNELNCGKPCGDQTAGYSAEDDIGNAATSISFPMQMLLGPLLNGCRVAHRAGGHAVARKKGSHELFCFPDL
jgi:hypothetical protein